MATKLIQLEDGTYIEVEVSEDKAQPISKRHAEQVKASFDKIQPILENLGEPIAAAFRELNTKIQVEQAEVDVGFSFEGEGNVYVTKARAGATLNVKLVVKPRPDSQ